MVASICAITGIFSSLGGTPVPAVSLTGENILLFGRGVYATDALMNGASFLGTDFVTMLVVLPLLWFSWKRYKTGSLHGALLLSGPILFFLYNGVSLAFAAAYNDLFLLYTALMSLSFFAFIYLMSSIQVEEVAIAVSPHMPNKNIAIFLFVSGSVVLLLWGSEIVGSLVSGVDPVYLSRYTTAVTHALDMGIIAPSVFLAGILILKNITQGYRIAFPLLILNVLVGPAVIAQTITQILCGVEFSLGQLIGMIGSWIILAGFGVRAIISLYNGLKVPT
jgi:hypothetical protein